MAKVKKIWYSEYPEQYEVILEDGTLVIPDWDGSESREDLIRLIESESIPCYPAERDETGRAVRIDDAEPIFG